MTIGRAIAQRDDPTFVRELYFGDLATTLAEQARALIRPDRPGSKDQ